MPQTLPPASPSRRRALRGATALLLPGLLAACGFHLRGPRPMPFATIYLDLGPYSEMGAALRRQIPTSGTTEVVDDPKAAEVQFKVLRDARTREILSLDAAGKVSEYRLIRTFGFRLVRKDGSEVIPPTELTQRRDMTYDDTIALAKEQEAVQLYRDMQGELVQQILRRLAAAKMN